MKNYSIFLVCFTFLLTSPVQADETKTFCKDYASQRIDRKIGPEESAVLSVCESELDSHDGTFLLLQNMYLPIPKEFFIFSDPGHFIVSMTSVDSTVHYEEWPYVTAHLASANDSILEQLENVDVSVRMLPPPVAGADCRIPIDIRQIEIIMVEGGYSQALSEARFMDYSLVVFGESSDLIQGMMDAFVRLNCKE